MLWIRDPTSAIWVSCFDSCHIGGLGYQLPPQYCAASILYFWIVEMIVLRCTLPIALKIGVRLAHTERDLQRVIAAEAAIRVDACSLPLYHALSHDQPCLVHHAD